MSLVRNRAPVECKAASHAEVLLGSMRRWWELPSFPSYFRVLVAIDLPPPALHVPLTLISWHRQIYMEMREGNSPPPSPKALDPPFEITAEGRRITKLDQILLNGNNIAIILEEDMFITAVL
ncbi:hypothetical protein ACLOJK_030616 [Asimina triloba]